VKPADDLVSPLVLEHLRQIRESAATNPNAARRGKRVQMEPGKSISLQELASGTSTSSVSRPAKRHASASASGRGGSKGKVAKIPVPVDSPSSSDSDENADDPFEETVGEERDLDVPVGGDEHEQENDGDTSDSDTGWNIEEVSVSKHEVEELPEDALEVGDYVLVKFSGKKTNYHFVGTLRNLVEPEKTTWDVKYFRRDCEAGVSSFVFKEPANPDLMETPICDIVKKLPKPVFLKNKLFH